MPTDPKISAGASQFQGRDPALRCWPERRLNQDRRKMVAMTDRIVAVTHRITDSVRNWPTSAPRLEPRTLRTPTSLLRPALRAVDRFMKFTQAINRMRM